MTELMEWTVYDSTQEEFKLVRARSQKEAIIEASRLGVLPRHTNHARPRTGDYTLMSIREFEDWVEEEFKGKNI